jgi:C-terminal processing protease CtpA/Prc
MQRYEELHRKLTTETDAATRKKIIQDMSWNVRADTLGTIEWAMSLEDPEEQRLAMEAISKNALVGIGARLEADESGFPKIKETTILSAAASKNIMAGDYIIGIVDGNGAPIYFNDLPMQRIIQMLRGEAGTDVTLLIERDSADTSQPEAFDVVIQRSMIVVSPPY